MHTLLPVSHIRLHTSKNTSDSQGCVHRMYSDFASLGAELHEPRTKLLPAGVATTFAISLRAHTAVQAVAVIETGADGTQRWIQLERATNLTEAFGSGQGGAIPQQQISPIGVAGVVVTSGEVPAYGWVRWVGSVVPLADATLHWAAQLEAESASYRYLLEYRTG